MGISGLLPLLKSIHQQRHLREYAGQTLGVDAYGWLHKGTIPCAIDLALGKPTTKYVDYVLHRVRMLKHFGITPYLVFDGDYLPSKASTETDRERKRAASKATGLELLSLKKTTDAHRELQKAVDVTPAMARAVIDACRKIGVCCIVAPYEADAQLYYLEKIGEIQGVISEDSDMLVFGVKCLITKLDQYGECVEISRDRFSSCKEVSLAGWSDKEFRMMCILSGCDYLDSIPGVGLKKAHGLVRRHKEIGKIMRSLQFDGTMRVPQGYRDIFTRAEITFLHQRVFCPRERKLVHCNEPDSPLEDEHLIYVGPDLDEHIARGVAYGQLDPMTKTPLQAPHTVNTVPPSTPQSYRKIPSPQKNKSITSFFKPKSQSTPRPPAPRTPLQPRDSNINVLRHTLSAPSLSKSTSIVKRPMVTAYTSNKKARVVDDPDDDPANGEQSEFFKRKPRKLSVQTPSKSQPVSAKAKQSPLPTTPATTETLHKADPSSNQETPSSLRLLETASPDTDDVDFTSKVTQGWKDHYGLRGGSLQKNPKLSDIIEKQRKASIQRAIPSPRRLGMPSNTGNTGFVERKLRRVCSTPLKKETSGPFISLGDSSGESQEEWPEFVGVGKFSASVSSSQNSSQSSQEAPAIKGLFGRFAFERNR